MYLVILIAFKRSPWSPLLSFLFTQEGCEGVWCIRLQWLSLELWSFKFFIWKPFKFYIIWGSCPYKHRGRPHTKGLSNCCERFATHSIGKNLLWQICLPTLSESRTDANNWPVLGTTVCLCRMHLQVVLTG